jgi:hypothetical protein
LIDDENAENIEETAENAIRNKRSYDRVKQAIAANRARSRSRLVS